MSYVLKEMTHLDKERVLRECGEKERRRLIRNGCLENTKKKGWTIDVENDSYLIRIIPQGDPREVKEEYYFHFDGRIHYIRTNGLWPLLVRFDCNEVPHKKIELFKARLQEAFSINGLYGAIGGKNESFDVFFEEK